jgi:hypothetical protein
MTDAGNLCVDRLQDHLKQLQTVKQQQTVPAASSTSEKIVSYPVTNDVLLGRGRPFQEFPGNVRLALLIDKYRERYFTAGRCDKAIISQHLVDTIKESKGRFLKKTTDSEGWVEVSDDVARDKVSHGFRTKTRRNTTTTRATLCQNTKVVAPTRVPSGLFGTVGAVATHDRTSDHLIKEVKRLRASPLGYR